MKRLNHTHEGILVVATAVLVHFSLLTVPAQSTTRSLHPPVQNIRRTQFADNYYLPESYRTIVDCSRFQKYLSSDYDNDEDPDQSCQNDAFQPETSSASIDDTNFREPHVTCHNGTDMSGYARWQDLSQRVTIEASVCTVIYNDDDETCWMCYISSSEAKSTENTTDISSSLMSPRMKIRKNVASSFSNSTSGDTSNGYFSSSLPPLLVELCAGVASNPIHIARTAEAVVQQATNMARQQSTACTFLFDRLSIDYTYTADDASFLISVGGVLPEVVPTDLCARSLVDSLALMSTVCSVEAIPPVRLTNLSAQKHVESFRPSSSSSSMGGRPWFELGLTGKNQVVAISDTGIYEGSCYFQELSSESSKIVDYSSQTTDSTEDDVQGHGTHVVGSIVGRKVMGGAVYNNDEGNGIAVDAHVSFYDIGKDDQCCFIPYGVNYDAIEDLLDPGKVHGAKVHSASWGSLGDDYNFYVKYLDRYIYNDESFLFVSAAGNMGFDGITFDIPSSVIWPGTAKNAISVGASNNVKTSPSDRKGVGYVSYFSARGPTEDRRIKPDIVAPGLDIYSARPFVSCGSQLKTGTSIATPLVSGSALLIRQYFEEGRQPNGEIDPSRAFQPSGTLVKAVLLNGAQNLFGVDNYPGGFVTPVEEYDNNQGFGELNLAHSLPLNGVSNFTAEVHDRIRIVDGAQDTYEYSVDGSCEMSGLSVTLVWADPPNPNSGCKKCLLNDLDLSVFQDEDVYYPNHLNGTDKNNNVERIRIDTSPGDIITVTVHARNLNTQYQTYALVVTGCFDSQDTKVMLASNAQSAQNFNWSSTTSSSSTAVPTILPTSLSSSASYLSSKPTASSPSSQPPLSPSPYLAPNTSPPMYLPTGMDDVMSSAFSSKEPTSLPSVAVGGLRSEITVSPASTHPSCTLAPMQVPKMMPKCPPEKVLPAGMFASTPDKSLGLEGT